MVKVWFSNLSCCVVVVTNEKLRVAFSISKSVSENLKKKGAKSPFLLLLLT